MFAAICFCMSHHALSSWLSNYPSYLYLAVVWIVRGGYLMSVYTPSQQILTPIMGSGTCRRGMKIGPAIQLHERGTSNYEFMSVAASSNNRLRSSAAARPASWSSSLPGNSITVSTHARAHAPFPALVPPSTCRFSVVSFKPSQRAHVGCVSVRSVGK